MDVKPVRGHRKQDWKVPPLTSQVNARKTDYSFKWSQIGWRALQSGFTSNI